MALTSRDNRLTITNETRLSDLTNFLAKQKAGHDLLARTDKNGNTVLYTRGTHGADFFRNIKDSVRKHTEGDVEMTKHDIKRERATKAISDFLKLQADKIGDSLQSKSEFIAKLDTSRTVDYGTSSKLGDLVRDTLMKTGLVYEGMHNLREEISVKETLSVLDHLNLITSRVEAVVQRKVDSFDETPELPPTKNKLGEGGKALEFTVDGEKKSIFAPNLVIDGTTFSPVEVKGGGAFGAVVRYEDNSRNSIAVKLPSTILQTEVNTQKEQAARELFNTARLVGDNPHVTGFNSHVELPDGKIALIGEMVPNGTVKELADTILRRYTPGDDTVPPPRGGIGSFERRLIALTLMSDAAKGLSHIQNQGVTHGDVKSLNLMIDGDGKAKLIDLGESTKTESLIPGISSFGENPLYSAPDGKVMRKEATERGEAIKKSNEEFFVRAMESFLGVLEDKMTDNSVGQRFREDATEKLKAHAGKIAQELSVFAKLDNNSDLRVSPSFDSFGLGTIGVDLLLGGNILENQPKQVERGPKFTSDDYIDGWRRSKAPAIGEGGLITRSTGDPHLDDFLNGMLDSDPKTRMTPKDIAEHPLSNAFGVGSPEVRNLIFALASNNEEQISQAVTRLREMYYV